MLLICKIRIYLVPEIVVVVMAVEVADGDIHVVDVDVEEVVVIVLSIDVVQKYNKSIALISTQSPYYCPSNISYY